MSDEQETDRRKVLKSGIALGGLAATAGMPFWSKLALAQGEELVPFTDVPEDYAVAPKAPGAIHFVDTRHIDSFYTSNDDFYVVQHYGQPEVDVDGFRLRLTGLIDKPLEFTLDELKSMEKVEIDAGFECGGNRQDFYHGLIGNAKWGGVRLRDLLEKAGVQDAGI
jgi:DMSO/TMAO reductase YedYZ molybdopterin-dependent catalytic subunit